jgi:hypothetical protein
MLDISQYRRQFLANDRTPYTSTTGNMFSGNTFDTNKGTLQFGGTTSHYSAISNTNPINHYGTTRVGTFCVFGVSSIISTGAAGNNGVHITSYLCFPYFNVAYIGANLGRIYFNLVDYSLRNASTGITTFSIPFNITNGLTFTLCTFSANTVTTVFETYMSNTVTSPDLKYIATNTIFNHPTTGSTSAFPFGVGGVPGTVTGVTYPISATNGQIGWTVDTAISFFLANPTNSSFESFYANSYTTADQAKLIHEYMMIKFRNKRFNGRFRN